MFAALKEERAKKYDRTVRTNKSDFWKSYLAISLILAGLFIPGLFCSYLELEAGMTVFLFCFTILWLGNQPFIAAMAARRLLDAGLSRANVLWHIGGFVLVIAGFVLIIAQKTTAGIIILVLAVICDIISAILLSRPSSAKRSIVKETDQNKLAKMAISETDRDNGKAAVERITDESLLAEVALKSSDYYVQEHAVRKLTQQKYIAKVASESDNKIIREAAIGRLTDQKALLAVVLNDPVTANAREAVKRLRDQDALFQAATQAKNADVRAMAVRKLDSIEKLRSVCESDSDSFVRQTAENRLETLGAGAEEKPSEAAEEKTPEDDDK